jgi:hypothetical protein
MIFFSQYLLRLVEGNENFFVKNQGLFVNIGSDVFMEAEMYVLIVIVTQKFLSQQLSVDSPDNTWLYVNVGFGLFFKLTRSEAIPFLKKKVDILSR